MLELEGIAACRGFHHINFWCLWSSSVDQQEQLGCSNVQEARSIPNGRDSLVRSNGAKGTLCPLFFFAQCCLGKVPGGAPFSQLHKGIGSIARTGQLMQLYKSQLYKSKQIQTKQRQQQIPNCGGREDETDARAVRPNSLARCIE